MLVCNPYVVYYLRTPRLADTPLAAQQAAPGGQVWHQHSVDSMHHAVAGGQILLYCGCCTRLADDHQTVTVRLHTEPAPAQGVKAHLCQADVCGAGGFPGQAGRQVGWVASR